MKLRSIKNVVALGEVLKNADSLEPLLRALARGFQLGLEAPCVIGCKLEDRWERSLADWQQELGLPVQSADSCKSWTRSRGGTPETAAVGC